MLSDSSRGFGRGVLRGFTRYSSLHGGWNLYHQQPDYLATSQTISLNDFKRWGADGVVCSIRQSAVIAELGLPMICYDPGNYRGRYPCIGSDDSAVGRLAANHLIEFGHRNFAFCGFGDLAWSCNRRDSFQQTVEALGGEVHLPQAWGQNEMSWLHEEPLIRAWIEQLPKPIGIFCANDDRAVSVAQVCLLLGLNIPDDVSLIGADNDSLICEMMHPPLTSVRIASDQAGYEAAELLSRLIRGEAKMEGQWVVAGAAGVVTRQSTNVLLVKHPALRNAVGYIREHVARPIQVAEVVRHAGLSHRALNGVFQAEFGASIGQYITKTRIQHISHLLVDTEMQIQEIALAVGYEDDRHFARYFKRSTGMTPQVFRRRHLAP